MHDTPLPTCSTATVYDAYARSVGPKTLITLIHAAAVGFSMMWFLPLGGTGVSQVDAIRRGLILGCAAVYLVRYSVMLFWFCERTVTWAEAVSVAAWIVPMHLTIALLGASVSAHLSMLDVVAVELYLAGSYINTKSEYQRMRWKQDSRNARRIFSDGWFRFSRHINFFGEVLLFSGYALLTRQLLALAIPVAVLALFLFVNIPVLDRHLAERYGDGFDAYARRTKRLVPWIY